jgi:hypothetical protein
MSDNETSAQRVARAESELVDLEVRSPRLPDDVNEMCIVVAEMGGSQWRSTARYVIDRIRAQAAEVERLRARVAELEDGECMSFECFAMIREDLEHFMAESLKGVPPMMLNDALRSLMFRVRVRHGGSGIYPKPTPEEVGRAREAIRQEGERAARGSLPVEDKAVGSSTEGLPALTTEATTRLSDRPDDPASPTLAPRGPGDSEGGR